MAIAEILSRIDRERLDELLFDAVDTYSPTFAEPPGTQVFASALRDADIAYILQPVLTDGGDETRANLIVQLGPVPPALLWVGHVDTIDLWHEEGHGAELEGDRLYGLGAADMKSGCAAIIEALIAVTSSGLPWRRGLCVALVVGEEQYGDGSMALLENRSVLAPLTVFGEPTNLQPCPSHFGYYELRLISKGLRAHAALPEVGANAIHAMLAWMLRILEECQRLPHGEQIAINPREIHGGETDFVIAESCEASVDFHLPPDITVGEIERVIRQAQETVLESHPGVQLEYEQLVWAPGFRYQEDDERLQPLYMAFEHTRLPWKPIAFRSHSDANLFQGSGTLSVVCGPGNLAVAHTRGEYVSLSEVEQAARLYAALIYEACLT